jgi:hypothetical protein
MKEIPSSRWSSAQLNLAIERNRLQNVSIPRYGNIVQSFRLSSHRTSMNCSWVKHSSGSAWVTRNVQVQCEWHKMFQITMRTRNIQVQCDAKFSGLVWGHEILRFGVSDTKCSGLVWGHEMFRFSVSDTKCSGSVWGHAMLRFSVSDKMFRISMRTRNVEVRCVRMFRISMRTRNVQVQCDKMFRISMRTRNVEVQCEWQNVPDQYEDTQCWGSVWHKMFRTSMRTRNVEVRCDRMFRISMRTRNVQVQCDTKCSGSVWGHEMFWFNVRGTCLFVFLLLPEFYLP